MTGISSLSRRLGVRSRRSSLYAKADLSRRSSLYAKADLSRRSSLYAKADLSRRSSPKASEGGWTLIELLIVLSLIMILATVAMTQYRNSVRSAKEATLKSDLMFMRDAIDQYYADKGKYPDSLQSLVSEQYLRAIPVDPFTRSSDTWQTTPAEASPGSGNASPGIYDVKSGSDEAALDGSRYSDWN